MLWKPICTSSVAIQLPTAPAPIMSTLARCWSNAGGGDGASGVRSRLEAARHQHPADYYRQMGWVLTALQNAFFWLMSGTSIEGAVIATVAKGGDTDTNAAICGALLGAAQGHEAVPQRSRNAILTCRPVPASGATHPRPTTYWPDDARELAEALLVARC